ncbi:MAG: DUF418 domain-containing protein [Novosphingobium sp.]|nr:DUF418 domain-containing protein [Novosphingobium sp.]
MPSAADSGADSGGDAPRIAALDLIRGVAVLGILAVNIAGFSGPSAAVYTPHAIHPPSLAGDTTFAAMLVAFEGKMRALFTILFGAGLLLFVERAEATGRDGAALQMQRLSWLALFGYLHFLLLWWGDILFLYAVAGMFALALRNMPSWPMLLLALVIFTLWQASGVAGDWDAVRIEHAVAGGTATGAETGWFAERMARRQAVIDSETARQALSFGALMADKLHTMPFYPLRVVWIAMGETLPWMMVGMLLLRTGFFAGQWPRAAMRGLAAAGIGLGGAATMAFAIWAWDNAFPVEAMSMAINYALGFPHLLMGLGYLSLLMSAAPRLMATRIGRRLIAAGRMAFSNYIGCSLVMTALFHGWGLGLAGKVPVAAEPLFVVLGWMLMLGWSKPWLARFRQGPLEWLWRSLTEKRWIAFQKH